ncbi:MAG TPA: DUF1559 domain-containing protein, partial [Planctomycetaceae bacterium]|nr:DUF1559 domain-containing protein [Planctomycetaceae bacterium]
CPTSTSPDAEDWGTSGQPGALTPQAVCDYKASAGSYAGDHGGLPAQPQQRRNGLFYRDSVIRLVDISDGTSNTVMAGESNWRLTQVPRLYGTVEPTTGTATGGSNRLLSHAEWGLNIPATSPTNNLAESFSSLHAGGANFALADGSVRFISDRIQHTAFPWNAANPFDQNNGGVGYGIYQRLFSRNDGLPLGDF